MSSPADAGHRCQPPTLSGGTTPIQPDWTCARCGRVWRDCRTGVGTQWWAEVQGPRERETTIEVNDGFGI